MLNAGNPIAILLTVLFSLLLIVTEMISELGLSVSSACAAQRRTGRVIGTAVPDRHVSTVSFSSTSSAIRQVKFEDGELQFISNDFPVHLDKSFCLKCAKFNLSTAILANCSVSNGRTYPAGSLAVGIGHSNSSSTVALYGFIALGEEGNETITGDGNVFASSNYKQGVFLVHTLRKREGHPIYTYFEYANQAHLKEVLQKLHRSEIQAHTPILEVPVLWEKTKGPTHTQEMQCGIEKFNSFGKVIYAYRSMQLENIAFPSLYDAEAEMFERITEDDLYRAGLTQKIGFSQMYNKSEIGEYMTYTKCAYFDWKYIVPLSAVMLVLMTLYVIGILIISIRKGTVQTVPYDSKTWFDEMSRLLQNSESDENISGSSNSGKDRSKRIDEFVLLNDGEGNMNIGYCRDGVMMNMKEVLPQG